jgi:ABC-type nickel/cobalt efflux system permease component RcnA
MNKLDFTSSSPWMDWLIFLSVILLVGLCVGGYLFWSMNRGGQRHHKHHKHRKRRRHQRQHNDTLAQSGGLPPVRENEPPHGL